MRIVLSIKVKNICKHFKTYEREAGLKGAFKSFFNRQYTDFHALTNINLEVNNGEILGRICSSMGNVEGNGGDGAEHNNNINDVDMHNGREEFL